MQKSKFLWFTVLVLLHLAGGADAASDLRLAWDAASARSLNAGVYARMEKTSDGHWLLGYSRGPAVYVRRSEDALATLGEEILVAKQANYNATNVEMLTLRNGWVLLAYNARPFDAQFGKLPYEIRVVISKDHGLTWQSDTAVYTAGKTPQTGCWEPVFLQYPDGEVQLFFANEFPYPDSDDQEISMMRSMDNGQTWSEQLFTVSYRAGSRDGMPVPALLQDGNSVAVAIEDNGIRGNFKPVILTSTLQARFTDGPLLADATERHYALAPESEVAARIYEGAPYLIALDTGETLLSVQSSDGRAYDHVNVSVPKVYVGDAQAHDFTNPGFPFSFIPDYGNGNWNSLAQINPHRVSLLSSIQGVPSENGYESIWLIEAELIRPLKLPRYHPTLDGENTHGEWSGPPPLFLGARSADTHLQGNLQYDDSNLYVYFDVQDGTLSATREQEEPDDESLSASADAVELGLGFVLQSVVESAATGDPVAQNPPTDPLPTDESGTEIPMEQEWARYKLKFSADRGTVTILKTERGETAAETSWEPLPADCIQRVVVVRKDEQEVPCGYAIEAAIPWSVLEMTTKPELSFSLQLTLTDDRQDGKTPLVETISGCVEDVPATWLTCTLSAVPRITYFDWQQTQAREFNLAENWADGTADDFDLDGISNGSAFASGEWGVSTPLSELIRPTRVEDRWVFGFQRHRGAFEVASHCLLLSLDDQPWRDIFSQTGSADVTIERLELPCPEIERYQISTGGQHTVKTRLETVFY